MTLTLCLSSRSQAPSSVDYSLFEHGEADWNGKAGAFSSPLAGGKHFGQAGSPHHLFSFNLSSDIPSPIDKTGGGPCA